MNPLAVGDQFDVTLERGADNAGGFSVDPSCSLDGCEYRYHCAPKSKWLDTQLKTGQFKLDQLSVEKCSAVPINRLSTLVVKWTNNFNVPSGEKPRTSINDLRSWGVASIN